MVFIDKEKEILTEQAKTEGLKEDKIAMVVNGRINKFYEEGIISRIYCSNLTYVSPELNDAPWFHAVDISELCARIINRLNYGKSIAKYMDATRIIHDLLNE